MSGHREKRGTPNPLASVVLLMTVGPARGLHREGPHSAVVSQADAHLLPSDPAPKGPLTCFGYYPS